MNARQRFDELVDDLSACDPDIEERQMMGRPCILAGGKMIACFEARGTLAFKLPDEAERERALALEGARIYDPANNGRTMGGWVEVPVARADEWPRLAETALRLRKEKA